MKKCIVVTASSDWYQGFIPFFIFYAQKACPEAQILVYLRGICSNNTKKAIKVLDVDKSKYDIIENYKIEYGNTRIASQLARWTIMDDYVQNYDYIYIGDIDIMLCAEDNCLFHQHLKNAKKINVPISNIVRKGQERLTGLHFFNTNEYYKHLYNEIVLLDMTIKQHALIGDIDKYFPKSDEYILYHMVNNARPDWIKNLLNSTFRPHHGVHIGIFRGSKIYKKWIKKIPSDPYLKWMQQFYMVYYNNRHIMDEALSLSNEKIQQIFDITFKYITSKGIVDSPIGWK